MKRFVIRDSEAGNVIEYFETVEEALSELKKYEDNDILKGIYEKNFYEIYDTEKEKIVDIDDYLQCEECGKWFLRDDGVLLSLACEYFCSEDCANENGYYKINETKTYRDSNYNLWEYRKEW